MSMAALRANLAHMGQLAASGFARPRLGVVTSPDPVNYCVKVQLQPAPAEGDPPETGWLPVWSPWVGNGWGFFAMPAKGDQVLVLFQEGDTQCGIVLGAIFSDEDRPLNAPVGELWVQHKSGSFLKFTNDGDVLVTTNKDLVANVGGKLQASVTGDASLTVGGNLTSQAQTWTHTGPLHVTQDITCDTTVTATTDVVGGGKSLKNHTHQVKNVQGGTATITSEKPT